MAASAQLSFPGNPPVLRENHDSFQTTQRSLLPQLQRNSKGDVDSTGTIAGRMQ
ncbi:MAG: hypothetical protein WCS87_14035 [Methylococcaceae bacterium]